MFLTLFQFSFQSIGRWIVEQTNILVQFLLMVLFFTVPLYLAVLILGFKNKTTLNEENQYFFKRSFIAVLILGIILGIAVGIIGFLAIILFVSFLGANNPLTAIMTGYFSDIAETILGSDTNALIFLAATGLILFLIATFGLKGHFRVKYGWAVLSFLLMLAIALGIYYLLNFALNLDIFTKFGEWSQYIETLLYNWLFPVS